MNGTLGKVARLFAANYQRSHDFVRADKRHDETRSKSSPHRDLADWARWLVANIRHLFGLSVQGRLADRIGSTELLVLDRRNQVLAQAISGPHLKRLVQFVENIDHASFRVRKLDRLGDDRGQHGR